MSMQWNWPGSRWRRVDLHAHSPASSYDFGSPEDRAAKDWARWIAAAKDAGLDAIAVTDHNTPDGIAGIQEAAKAIGSVAVFPGVELTVGGIHLACILEPDRSRDHVVAILSKLGIAPEAFARRETVSLSVANGQTHVSFAGGLQEELAREEICRVMEGGREAFDSRYRRITRGCDRTGG
jgi:predicted metal-dependent phosphoesterase TrpH